MMAEEKDKPPSPTPYEMERAIYGRAHPDFRKGELVKDYKPEEKAKEQPKEEPPQEEPKDETKAIEAAKPAAGYRTRAQKPAGE